MSEEVARRVNGLRAYTYTLAAGVPKNINVSGDWIQVVTAPVNDLQVRFDESQNVPMYAGQGARTYYSTVQLSSATGQTVTVWLGYGHAVDSRATANVNVAATIAPGNTIDDGGDVALISGAAGLLSAQDTARLFVIIKNPSSNSATIRVGTATVGAANGTPVEPGETFSMATTAAVYGFQNSGVSVTVSSSSIKQV